MSQSCFAFLLVFSISCIASLLLLVALASPGGTFSCLSVFSFVLDCRICCIIAFAKTFYVLRVRPRKYHPTGRRSTNACNPVDKPTGNNEEDRLIYLATAQISMATGRQPCHCSTFLRSIGKTRSSPRKCAPGECPGLPQGSLS